MEAVLAPQGDVAGVGLLAELLHSPFETDGRHDRVHIGTDSWGMCLRERRRRREAMVKVKSALHCYYMFRIGASDSSREISFFFIV